MEISTFVDDSKIIYVYAKKGVESQILVEAQNDAEAEHVGGLNQNAADKDTSSETDDSEFVDSDYDFNEEGEDDDDDLLFQKYVDKGLERDMHMDVGDGSNPTDSDSAETVYANSQDMDSCSSTDEDVGVSDMH